MNRMEFMTELASLLQDIPAEDRRDAMQYYNDYFDDAGEELEQQVIEELESPAKVAEKIKANLTEDGDDRKGDQTYQSGEQPPRERLHPASGSGRTWKIILIAVVILCALPVILPVAFGILCGVIGILFGIFGLFLALVATAASILIAGIALIVSGIFCLVPEVAVGLALIGSGLILSVLGVIALVGAVKLCAVAIPAILRGLMWLCRKPFERKAVNRS